MGGGGKKEKTNIPGSTIKPHSKRLIYPVVLAKPWVS